MLSQSPYIIACYFKMFKKLYADIKSQLLIYCSYAWNSQLLGRRARTMGQMEVQQMSEDTHRKLLWKLMLDS